MIQIFGYSETNIEFRNRMSMKSIAGGAASIGVHCAGTCWNWTRLPSQTLVYNDLF